MTSNSLIKQKSLLLFCLLILGLPAPAQDEIRGWTENKEQEEAIRKPELPKNTRKYLDDMVRIESGSYLRNPPHIASFTEHDSTLVNDKRAVRISMPTFLISGHEVTNQEYREFTNWVARRTAYEILAASYPEKYRNADGSINEDLPIKWGGHGPGKAFLPAAGRKVFQQQKGNGHPQIKLRQRKNLPGYTLLAEAPFFRQSLRPLHQILFLAPLLRQFSGSWRKLPSGRSLLQMEDRTPERKHFDCPWLSKQAFPFL